MTQAEKDSAKDWLLTAIKVRRLTVVATFSAD